MGQLDMNHALVMALATIHLGNVMPILENVCVMLTSKGAIVKVSAKFLNEFHYFNFKSRGWASIVCGGGR